MQFSRTVLPSGLRVIIVPIKEVQSATTLVMVGAGSRYETAKNNGISHFLEHMAFKGTKKRPTALEIATLLDGIGAESNAFTGKEYTGYYVRSAATHVPLALDIIGDFLSEPTLVQTEIDKERNVIIEEINLYEDTPMRNIGDIFEELLYKDDPMGRDIAGTKEIIRAVNREVFVDYMSMYYSTKNMSVIIAGNVDEDEAMHDIEKVFKNMSTFETPDHPPVKEKQNGIQIKLKHKTTEQAHFALGVRTVGLPDEKDRYPLSVLSSILGGGMSSRLFHEVREKRGLGYYVRAYAEHYIDCGYLSAFAGVDPKRIDEAIKVIVEEMKKVTQKDEIKEREVKKAKEYIKGHFILGLEDTKSVAGFFGTDEILNRKIETPEEVIEKINAVSAEDVYRVAAKYIDPKGLNLAVIGDFKDEDHFATLLK